jgi:hypothetical protein
MLVTRLFLKDAFSKIGKTEEEDDNISHSGFFDWVGCMSDFAGGGSWFLVLCRPYNCYDS